MSQIYSGNYENCSIVDHFKYLYIAVRLLRKTENVKQKLNYVDLSKFFSVPMSCIRTDTFIVKRDVCVCDGRKVTKMDKKFDKGLKTYKVFRVLKSIS